MKKISKKLFLILMVFSGCEANKGIPPDLTIDAPATQFTAVQVESVVQAAALAIDGTAQTIAVVDRAGNPLAVFAKPAATAQAQELALSVARTAAFFSNDQAPLSSRTVGYISRDHFPPGIANTASGALFGIEHTNRGCSLNAVFLAGQDITPATTVAGASPGVGVTVTPGGVPLYIDGRVVGGVGVAGVSEAAAEFAAFSGLALFPPTVAEPGVIFIDGIELPFVKQTSRPAGFAAGAFVGAYTVAPIAGSEPPTGDLVAIIDSPTADDPKLLAADVETILDAAEAASNRTRAAIRLPLGQRAKMAMAVTDLEGNILGLRRMRDSTVFSLDVAVAKARNVTYFSGAGVDVADQIPGLPAGTAYTNRTIGFSSQPFFPSGINDTDPGPLRELFEFDEANPCTQGREPANANQNGIVFFPGSSPLYKEDGAGNRVLVGGLGVSGDGVEQDDYVTAQAIDGYQAPSDIRADQYVFGDVRLPYFKFPRNPEE